MKDDVEPLDEQPDLLIVFGDRLIGRPTLLPHVPDSRAVLGGQAVEELPAEAPVLNGFGVPALRLAHDVPDLDRLVGQPMHLHPALHLLQFLDEIVVVLEKQPALRVRLDLYIGRLA